MYQAGDYIIYRRDLCKINEIIQNHFNHKDYYILAPVDDLSLIIDVPTDNCHASMRTTLTKEEVEALIQKIPTVPIIECDTKMIENEYKRLLQSDNPIDLIRIIKTTYLRNKERTDNKKKIGDKDSFYFNIAEKYLYNEFAFVLKMDVEAIKRYITEQINYSTQ